MQNSQAGSENPLPGTSKQLDWIIEGMSLSDWLLPSQMGVLITSCFGTQPSAPQRVFNHNGSWRVDWLPVDAWMFCLDSRALLSLPTTSSLICISYDGLEWSVVPDWQIQCSPLSWLMRTDESA